VSEDVEIGENLAITLLGLCVMAFGIMSMIMEINGSVTIAVFGVMNIIIGIFVGKKKGSGEKA